MCYSLNLYKLVATMQLVEHKKKNIITFLYVIS